MAGIGREPGGKWSRDSGASLVEFAILLPLLILLVLGIIEFGWLLGLNNDVRHGAREGARYAAVDGGDNAAIHDYACQAMEPVGGGFASLTMELAQNGNKVGDTGTLTITGEVTPLTGFGLMALLLPDQLSSTIDFRLERDVSWTDDGAPVPVSC